MTQYTEIEFKNFLTKAKYKELINYFSLNPCDLESQTNIYFDTSDFTLSKQKKALRIRLKASYIELTLKEETLNANLEITDFIKACDVDNIIKTHTLPDGDVKERLKTLNVNMEFKQIVELTTHRFEFNYGDDLIALDKSFYYGHIDYEIELETKNYDLGKSRFNELLKQFQITPNQPKHKIIRALEYKKSLK